MIGAEVMHLNSDNSDYDKDDSDMAGGGVVRKCDVMVRWQAEDAESKRIIDVRPKVIYHACFRVLLEDDQSHSQPAL